MTHNEKDDVDKAITSVKTSSEVMFFGRVFAGSIIGNMTFTREVSSGLWLVLQVQIVPPHLSPDECAHIRPSRSSCPATS